MCSPRVMMNDTSDADDVGDWLQKTNRLIAAWCWPMPRLETFGYRLLALHTNELP